MQPVLWAGTCVQRASHSIQCSAARTCRPTLCPFPAPLAAQFMHHGTAPDAFGAVQEYGDLSDAVGQCCTSRCYNLPHAFQARLVVLGIESVELDRLPAKRIGTCNTGPFSGGAVAGPRGLRDGCPALVSGFDSSASRQNCGCAAQQPGPSWMMGSTPL